MEPFCCKSVLSPHLQTPVFAVFSSGHRQRYLGELIVRVDRAVRPITCFMLTLLGCCSTLARLSRGAAKSAAARWRRLGGGSVHPHWTRRATVCETCCLRVIRSGKSYCGKPLLHHIDRDPTVDGCGCPTHDKARGPDEHCPIDPRHEPARRINGICSCKWCSALIEMT